MLIKWIVCQVSEETRDAFSSSQSEWTALKHVDGFIGQIGGWNTENPLEACILAFWRDEEAYQAFMTHHHDMILANNKQQGTYTGIAVNLFKCVIPIQGSSESLSEALRTGSFVRVSDNTVRDGRSAHFIEMQQEVWNPGMAAFESMLAGVFSQHRTDQQRYLVASMWLEETQHAHYATTAVSELRQRADVNLDIAQSIGTTLQLEPLWTVLGD
ncbi:MAG: YdbC family protein [Tumebacillaceae bacterium]